MAVLLIHGHFSKLALGKAFSHYALSRCLSGAKHKPENRGKTTDINSHQGLVSLGQNNRHRGIGTSTNIHALN